MSIALQPGPAIVDLDAVVVGERDRVDLGDVAALAASIEGVGLLHPVVLSPSRQLIAGGRRLAAVRSLGWVRVPVTVAELSTVEELLRAEADENTQRKALTGTEALAAAERREKILAEMARERQRQAPGEARGVKVSGGNLPQQSATETGKTRDLAAVGTGFSATSLRKVAVVRDAAEAETVRHGGRDVPVPEPVRQVAREALAAVSQPGAKVDPAHRAVAAALHRHVEASPEVGRARWRLAFAKALERAAGVAVFPEADVAANADEEQWAGYRDLHAAMGRHVERCRALREPPATIHHLRSAR